MKEEGRHFLLSVYFIECQQTTTHTPTLALDSRMSCPVSPCEKLNKYNGNCYRTDHIPLIGKSHQLDGGVAIQVLRPCDTPCCLRVSLCMCVSGRGLPLHQDCLIFMQPLLFRHLIFIVRSLTRSFMMRGILSSHSEDPLPTTQPPRSGVDFITPSPTRRSLISVTHQPASTARGHNRIKTGKSPSKKVLVIC